MSLPLVDHYHVPASTGSGWQPAAGPILMVSVLCLVITGGSISFPSLALPCCFILNLCKQPQYYAHSFYNSTHYTFCLYIHTSSVQSFTHNTHPVNHILSSNSLVLHIALPVKPRAQDLLPDYTSFIQAEPSRLLVECWQTIVIFTTQWFFIVISIFMLFLQLWHFYHIP